MDLVPLPSNLRGIRDLHIETYLLIRQFRYRINLTFETSWKVGTFEAQPSALPNECTKSISMPLSEILERLYDGFQLDDMQ
jgi:hypothetical protein